MSYYLPLKRGSFKSFKSWMVTLKSILGGVILWAMKIINELFNPKEQTLLKFVNISPFMLARNSPKVRIFYLSIRNKALLSVE